MNTTPPDDDAAPPVAVRYDVPPSIRVGVFGTFLILFVGALYYARGFVLPLVMACLLTLTLSPLVRRLARLGMPAALSAILLVGVVGLGIGAASVFLSGPLSKMAAQVPDTAATLRERLAFLKGPISALNSIGKDIEGTMNGSAGETGPTPTVVVSDGNFVRWLLGTLADFGTTLGATLLLTMFLLAAMDELRRKLVSILPALSGKKRSLRVIQEIESDVSRYLVTVLAINAGLGFMVGSAMALLGLGNAIVWGVAAALLNFVPFVGATVGISLVAAASLATFDGLAAAAAPPLIYFGLQVVEGSFVTPMVLGRRLSLSPIAILTMLSLTTWLWGIVGTILGVPLLVVFKVFCDQFPSLATVGVFLTGETAAIEEAEDGKTLRAVASGAEPVS
jgi:predicted PurR-regulated permease PerM